MNVLGIETSCDETAAAVVVDGWDVRSNVVWSQIKEHQPYGGVVPEIASRCHVQALPRVLQEAVDTAGLDWPDLDAVAVTRGPGLASALLIGLSGAKALSLRIQKPLIGINHLEAHLYSMFLNQEAVSLEETMPMLALLVSGGHSCLVRMKNKVEYNLLGQTLDDAAGEALDKGAKVLGLGYPGGPAIEAAADGGDPASIEFPNQARIKDGRKTGGLDPACCFSFSGVKTALLYHVRKHPECLSGQALADVSASYQEAIFHALLKGLERAVDAERPRAIACVGGVAKNKVLRAKLQTMADAYGCRLLLAPMAFCTDNAAMIAGLAGAENRKDEEVGLEMDIVPNLPLSV